MAEFPAPGTVLGRYRLGRELGRGALGVVYEAVADGHAVAVKVLLPDGAGPDAATRARIDAEYAALAGTGSPSVLVPMERAQHDGYDVLASPLFAAGSLAGLLGRRGPLGRPAALALCTHVARALHDAHRVGVVHGGVKPANIFPSTRDGVLVPLLADFGGALRSGGWASPSAAGVAEDPYAAPEVLRGAPADRRSDVYSLGCLLFAALTGAAPYGGPAPEHPAAIPQVPVGDTVDVGVNDLITAALQPAPEHRLPDVAEFGRRLGALTAARPEPIAAGHAGGAAAEPAGPATDAAPAAGAAGVQAAAAQPSDPSSPAEPAEPAATAPAGPVGPVATPPPAADVVPEPTDDEAGHGRRRALALVAAVVVTAVVIGAVSYARSRHQGPVDAAPVTRQHRHVAPLTPPQVQVRPQYRAVAFDVTAGAAGSTLQVARGHGWRPAAGRTIAVATPMGGRRACVKVRAVQGDRASVPVSACGTSAPPTLAMRSIGPCTISTTAYTHCYQLHLAGFATGTVQVHSAAPDSTGVVQHYTDPVEVGADGRGVDTVRFGASESQRVDVTVAGVSQRFSIG